MHTTVPAIEDADHGHVEGIDKEDATEWAKLPSDLHPADVKPENRP